MVGIAREANWLAPLATVVFAFTLDVEGASFPLRHIRRTQATAFRTTVHQNRVYSTGILKCRENTRAMCRGGRGCRCRIELAKVNVYRQW
jgi:hypothetical protein